MLHAFCDVFYVRPLHILEYSAIFSAIGLKRHCEHHNRNGQSCNFILRHIMAL